jgi:dTDP-4-dehydrorhamnose reductase
VSVPPILVTGGSGQVAQALGLLGDQRVQVVGRPAFDFDAPATITAALESARPALVVNTAAWTAVDLAESQAEAAWRANAAGPAEIGRWCAAAGVPLIHISTDYVFDGEKGAAYIEADPTSPTGVYGASKLAGEQAVLAACSHAVVLRTSWVYAARGKNFVRTMLALAEQHDRVRVVADQVGCPTNADDLAVAILAIANRLRRLPACSMPRAAARRAGTAWPRRCSPPPPHRAGTCLRSSPSAPPSIRRRPAARRIRDLTAPSCSTFSTSGCRIGGPAWRAPCRKLSVGPLCPLLLLRD